MPSYPSSPINSRFDPMGTERQDGLATIEWLRRQPWYPGEFATLGPSYCGFAQWAIAADSGPEHRADAAQYAASELRGQLYAGGAYSLETALSWTLQTATQERPLGWLYLVGINRRLRRKKPIFWATAAGSGQSPFGCS